ncbi:MAG: Nif3-like dinuclear metal center hexameric protein [Chitinophagales bacterium]
MKISEVANYLEAIAPLSLQEHYDNAGLITGSHDQEVTGILVCLDSIEAVIDEAISLECNLIIAHHPIVFSGVKKITGANYVERTIIKAIRNNIAIYAIHTNLDNVFDGVNRTISEKLGLVDCRILSPKSGFLKKLVTFAPHGDAGDVRTSLFNAGAGSIGNYDHCSFNMEGTGTFRGNEASNPHTGTKGIEHLEPETRIEVIFPSNLERQVIDALIKAHPYEEVAYDIYSLDNKFLRAGAGMVGNLKAPVNPIEFLLFIKQAMNCQVIRHTALPDKKIKTVAVCGGSGSFLLNDAIRAGADIFITADFKYHQFFDADGKIIVADIGHYESEHHTIRLLSDLLMKKFPTFAVHFSKINTNPINYI